MKPDEFLSRLSEEGAIAILRTSSADRVRPAMEAAISGGFRIVEITLNTPDALRRIAELAQREEVIVGAGTVLEVEQVKAAVDAGARFVVSPVVDPRVIETVLELGAIPIPGTLTPTEMLSAVRAGAPLQKLFPAPENGPDHVRACLGPMPFLRLVPTSGVDEQNAARYFECGAFAVGFVRSLFDPGDVEARLYDRIELRARKLLDVVRRARAS